MEDIIKALYKQFNNMDDEQYLEKVRYKRRTMINIQNDLTLLSAYLEKTYPYYSIELFEQKDDLFYPTGLVNPWIFGEFRNMLGALYYDLTHKKMLSFWQYIHPEVIMVSQQLFIDGHYYSAVDGAFKEICSRVRKLRAKMGAPEIKSDKDMMRNTFNRDTPLLLFDDNMTKTSGKNVHEGYCDIIAGAIQAIRNPNAHENIPIDEGDAVRKLMLASLLMHKIDEAVAFKGIRE